MKPMGGGRSFRQSVFFFMGIFGLALVMGYTFLMDRYLVGGLDTAGAMDMALLAREYAAAYAEDNRTPLPVEKRVRGYLGYGTLPEDVKGDFPETVLENNRFVVTPARHMRENPGRDFLQVFPARLGDGSRFYLVKRYTREDHLPGTFDQIRTLDRLAWPLGIGVIVLILAGVHWMMHRISGPVAALALWADKVTPDELATPHPDFRFQEVNALADRLQEALVQFQKGVEREHRFLRHASHELRTPIAVIRSNLDLLDKTGWTGGDDVAAQSLARIRRAGDTMQQLTETLLWLSRSEDAAPALTSFDLAALTAELVEEHRYLIAGKPVAIEEDLTSCIRVLPRIPCRIVLANLIRNGMQHTWKGTVSISTSKTGVTIENRNIEGEDMPGEERYGLGLILVMQIAERMGWHYEVVPVSGGRRTTIGFFTKKMEETAD